MSRLRDIATNIAVTFVFRSSPHKNVSSTFVTAHERVRTCYIQANIVQRAHVIICGINDIVTSEVSKSYHLPSIATSPYI